MHKLGSCLAASDDGVGQIVMKLNELRRHS
jgi:hypothetical protein